MSKIIHSQKLDHSLKPLRRKNFVRVDICSAALSNFTSILVHTTTDSWMIERETLETALLGLAYGIKTMGRKELFLFSWTTTKRNNH